MKKKLEADLLSIAHRILQMKNKSDQDQVFAEVQKLYEKLTVMRFVDAHFSEIKPTAGSADIEAEMEKAFGEAADYEAKENEAGKPNEEDKAPVKEDKSDNKGEGDQKEGKDAAEGAEGQPVEDSTTAEKPVEASNADPEEKPSGEEKPEAAEETGDKPEAATRETEAGSIKEKEDAETSEAEAPSDVEKEETEASEESKEAPEEEEKSPEANAEAPVEKEAPAKEDTKETETPKEEAPKEEDKKEERKPTQISFDDLMQHHYEEPVFERADAPKKEAAVPVPETVPQPEALEEAAVALGGDEDIKVVETPKAVAPQEDKRPSSLHEQIGKTITIGLNDRIGFDKNLFGGSAEDMNRVLSQLNTFNNLQEARDFIEDMVKPDYNNWTGKEDYEQRFLDIVERKFS